MVDPRTNQLFVQDTVARLEDVRRLILRIDIPVPQVLIEARIVEADDKFSRSLGVRRRHFGLSAQYRRDRYLWKRRWHGDHFCHRARGTVTTTGVGTGGGGHHRRPTLTSTANFVNLPATGIGGFNPSGFALTLVNASLSQVSHSNYRRSSRTVTAR